VDEPPVDHDHDHDDDFDFDAPAAGPVTISAARRAELEQRGRAGPPARGADTPPPRRRPATRSASSRYLPSERVIGVLLVVVAVGAGYALLKGLVPILVAPDGS